MAKLDIVINCFNGEDFLPQALASIKAQSFQDFRVIFVDNCSTDQSGSIARAFGEKMNYVKTEKHLSLGEARNYALRFCESPYIAFLDCDDLWEPDKVEKQISLLEKNPDCVMAVSNHFILNMENMKKRVFFRGQDEKKIPFEDFAIDYKYAISSIILRKEKLSELPVWFDERLSFAEEYDLFLRLAYHGLVLYSPFPTCTYRVHGKMNSKKLKLTIPYEYDCVLENLDSYIEDFRESFPAVFQYISFQRDFTKTKIHIEQKENRLAREAIRPYRGYNKKARIFYLLTFLPSPISSNVFKKIYRTKI